MYVEIFTPPSPINLAFLTPSPTIETPSQGPKRVPKHKRHRIQLVNYLDDHGANGKQKTRTRHNRFRVKPYKYSMGEEEEED